MFILGFYDVKISFYIKNTKFGLKNPKIELCSSNLALNEDIRKVKVPFCSANNLNFNHIWFPWDLS